MKSDAVHVVVAAIVDQNNQVLLALRPDHVHQGGLWEFPGGKIEPGESPRQALARELKEELGLQVVDARPLIRVLHHYQDKTVLLDVWYVDRTEGHPQGCEGQLIRWVNQSQLDDYSFPAANQPIISALKLPPFYFISPEPDIASVSSSGSGSDGSRDQNHDIFLARLEQVLASGIRLVQLRTKQLSTEQLKSLATRVVSLCHRYQARLMINDAIELVQDVGADGVHLTSRSLMNLKQRPIDKTLWLAASCHNQTELEHASAIGVDFAVIAPVKETSSHPLAQPMGWQAFQALSEQATIPVYALGGMMPEDVQQAWDFGAQGIAGISGFWKGGEMQQALVN